LATKYSSLVKVAQAIFPHASHFSPKIISNPLLETVIKPALGIQIEDHEKCLRNIEAKTF
jgi:hypothetical protein